MFKAKRFKYVVASIPWYVIEQSAANLLALHSKKLFISLGKYMMFLKLNSFMNYTGCKRLPLKVSPIVLFSLTTLLFIFVSYLGSFQGVDWKSINRGPF